MVVILTPAPCAGAVAEENHHEHHLHLNEIGLSTGWVWLQAESESAQGLHLHYMRRLGEGGVSRFLGLGLGYEVIFSQHSHHSILVQLGIFPWKKLVITVSPGILFHKEETTERKFSLHFEIVYEFELGTFEIGPAVGFATAGSDRHFTLGVHVGKGF